MGKLRSRRVISALIEHLNDPEKSIRRIILESLKRITGKKMSGPLPKDEKALQCFIARWREWWKGELLG
jgi:HEAT repeat protein